MRLAKGRQFRIDSVAKCRQARMKIARHGAVAECRVWGKDDLSPALAGRLNRSLQKVTASESPTGPAQREREGESKEPRNVVRTMLH